MSRIRHEREHRHGLGDVLQLLWTERIRGQMGPPANLAPDRLRYANTARVGERTDARGEVDALADDFAVTPEDVTEMDADPKPQVFVAAQSRLNRERTIDRQDGAWKDRQRLIAGRFEQFALELLDERLQQRTMPFTNAKRKLHVRFGDPGVAHHIGEQDRS